MPYHLISNNNNNNNNTNVFTSWWAAHIHLSHANTRKTFSQVKFTFFISYFVSQKEMRNKKNLFETIFFLNFSPTNKNKKKVF